MISENDLTVFAGGGASQERGGGAAEEAGGAGEGEAGKGKTKLHHLLLVLLHFCLSCRLIANRCGIGFAALVGAPGAGAQGEEEAEGEGEEGAPEEGGEAADEGPEGSSSSC